MDLCEVLCCVHDKFMVSLLHNDEGKTGLDMESNKLTSEMGIPIKLLPTASSSDAPS